MIKIISSGFGLPEGPVWDSDRDELLVCDASGGGVFRVPLDGGGRITVLPHRRGIGGLAIHAEGGYVVSGKNVSWKNGGVSRVLAEVDLDSGTARFNDLTTSPEGRVYAGTIDFALKSSRGGQRGSLFMIDLDGRVEKVAGDISMTNGMGFSPNGRYLYHVDSGSSQIRRYRVFDDGTLSQWNEFFRWDEGVPDGLAMGEDGSIWIALGNVAGRGYVAVLETNGEERTRIEMPHSEVRSLCFGGRGAREIFVTLGGDVAAANMDGVVAKASVDIAGLEVPLARVHPYPD